MRKYLLKIPVLLAFAAVFIFSKTEMKENFDFKANDPLNLIVKFIPQASKVEEANYINKWSGIYDSTGVQIGKYILSSPYCDNFIGYGGSIPLAFIADKSDKILGIGLFENNETPSWVDGLQNIKFFDSWNGKTLAEASELQVDAVTGATFTTRTVKDILIKRSGIFSGSLRYKKTKQKLSIKWMEDKLSPVLYFILLASLTALFVKKLNQYRIYFQIASIIFFGIISGKFVSVSLLQNISANGITILTSSVALILLGLSIFLPLIFNKHFYCFYICPFGGVQTLLQKIPVKKIQIKAQTIRLLRGVRLMIFVCVLITIAASLKIDLSQIEPFTVFIFSSASVTVITGSIIILIASIFIKTPWCVYFCPTGQFFDLLKDGFSFRSLSMRSKK